jgi:hypothetical protein
MAQRQYNFGTGRLFLTPVGGGAPTEFGAIQDVSVNISGATKQLYGAYGYPLDTGRGKQKIEGKASFGQVDPVLYNALYFGGAVVTGEVLAAFNEAGTIPTTPFQVTVANAATFKSDLGVYFSTTGLPLLQVASGPVAGQYSVSAGGVYTFSTTDTAKAVVINYLYNSAATGKTMSQTNPLMGSIPTFQLILADQSKGKSSTLTLYSCTSSKLDFPFKMDDYMLASFDFAAQDDGTGRIFSWTNTVG